MLKDSVQIVTAYDSKEALDAMRRYCPDLILLDNYMPGMDGQEATRRIRAIEAEHNDVHTPIVALTANVSAEDRDACLAAGMDGFLVKPLDRERLAAALAASSASALAA